MGPYPAKNALPVVDGVSNSSMTLDTPDEGAALRRGDDIDNSSDNM